MCVSDFLSKKEFHEDSVFASPILLCRLRAFDTDTVTHLLRIEQVPSCTLLFFLSQRFASCFASVQFHIDMRRFRSASEVELLKMLDFYEAPFVAGDVAVVVCVIKDDFTFDDSPQIFSPRV